MFPVSNLTPVCQTDSTDEHRRPVWKVRWQIRRQCRAAPGFSPPSTCFTPVLQFSSEPLCGRGESLCSSPFELKGFARYFVLVLSFLPRCSCLPEVTTGGGVSLSGRAPVEITGLRQRERTWVRKHPKGRKRTHRSLSAPSVKRKAPWSSNGSTQRDALPTQTLK